MGSTIDSLRAGGYWVCDRDRNCRQVTGLRRAEEYLRERERGRSKAQSSSPRWLAHLAAHRGCVIQSRLRNTETTIRRVMTVDTALGRCFLNPDREETQQNVLVGYIVLPPLASPWASIRSCRLWLCRVCRRLPSEKPG